jgi:hypothetical protein
MSILDDAIREHLDLKRRHGAAESDVKRLEDEAFGPPTRPGEPDFPDSEAPDEAGEPPEDDLSAAAPEAPLAPPPAETAEPPSAVEETVVEHQVLADEPEGAAEIPEAEEIEEAPPLPDEGAADAPDAATAIFDHTADADFELEDLDLELEDEELETEEPAGREAPPEQKPPIESLETQEHRFADELIVPDEVGAAPEPEDEEEEELAEEPLPDEGADDEPADEPDSSEEDVLADTPEFLKDAPEDDELWFEQGKPKDFDFDE